VKRLALLATLALVLAPAARAKGPIQACGPKTCVTVASEGDGMGWLMGLPGGAAIPAASSYYVLRFADIGSVLGYWIPSASIVRFVGTSAVGTWTNTDDAGLRAATAGLAAFAPPRGATVYVNGDNVEGDATYLRLFTIGVPVAPPSAVRWLPIWISGPATPWTDSYSDLRISRKGNYLYRNGLVFTIPLATAKKIRSLQPLG
jgi:hypothetical protein